jgi:hypothetical protein
MKSILIQIKKYFYETDKKVLSVVSVFITFLIFLNYYFRIDAEIGKQNSFLISFFSRYIIFLVAFALPYLFYRIISKKKFISSPVFLFLVIIAPAIFSLKSALHLSFRFSENLNWNNYWNQIVYWPLLVTIIGGLLFITWRLFDNKQTFYGLKTKGMDWKPYLLMLLIMIPLIAAASTQPDFLAVYPKMKTVAGVYNEPGMQWWHKLFFEISYGTDFITI